MKASLHVPNKWLWVPLEQVLPASNKDLAEKKVTTIKKAKQCCKVATEALGAAKQKKASTFEKQALSAASKRIAKW